jgi:hypothetical protein
MRVGKGLLTSKRVHRLLEINVFHLHRTRLSDLRGKDELDDLAGSAKRGCRLERLLHGLVLGRVTLSNAAAAVQLRVLQVCGHGTADTAVLHQLRADTCDKLRWHRFAVASGAEHSSTQQNAQIALGDEERLQVVEALELFGILGDVANVRDDSQIDRCGAETLTATVDGECVLVGASSGVVCLACEYLSVKVRMIKGQTR